MNKYDNKNKNDNSYKVPSYIAGNNSRYQSCDVPTKHD